MPTSGYIHLRWCNAILHLSNFCKISFHVAHKIPFSGLVIAVMRFFASDCVVFFCKESLTKSRNVARISLYPAFRAKTARALALHRVAEVDLGTLICFVSKQSLIAVST